MQALSSSQQYERDDGPRLTKLAFLKCGSFFSVRTKRVKNQSYNLAEVLLRLDSASTSSYSCRLLNRPTSENPPLDFALATR